MNKRDFEKLEARLQDAEHRAKEQEIAFQRKVLDSMSVEDLRILADEKAPEQLKDELWERAVHEYKSKAIEKA